MKINKLINLIVDKLSKLDRFKLDENYGEPQLEKQDHSKDILLYDEIQWYGDEYISSYDIKILINEIEELKKIPIWQFIKWRKK